MFDRLQVKRRVCPQLGSTGYQELNTNRRMLEPAPVKVRKIKSFVNTLPNPYAWRTICFRHVSSILLTSPVHTPPPLLNHPVNQGVGPLCNLNQPLSFIDFKIPYCIWPVQKENAQCHTWCNRFHCTYYSIHTIVFKFFYWFSRKAFFLLSNVTKRKKEKKRQPIERRLRSVGEHHWPVTSTDLLLFLI